MRSHTRYFQLAALSLVLAACEKKGADGTNSPDEAGDPTKAGPSADVDPSKASAEAKRAFYNATEAYKSAKADGMLSSDECSRVAARFADVYERFGKQMAVAKFNVGAIWEECGDTEKAQSTYLALTQEAPKYDLPYNNLGVLYWKRGQERRALDFFERAVKANAKTKAPRNNLAAALRNKYTEQPAPKEFTEAERQIQSVLAVESDNRAAYENLARLYYDRGRIADKSYLLLADLVITQALKILQGKNGKSADLNNLRGLILMEEGNMVEALRWFKEAVAISPDHADAHMNIAMIAIRFRDYTTAEKSLTTALKDGRQRNNPDTYLALGVAQRGLKQYDKAEASFKKARQMDDDDPRAFYNLGILYQEHRATRDDVNVEGVKAANGQAKEYYDQFIKAAAENKKLSGEVSDAKGRIATIDESFQNFKELAELEKQAKQLEELAKKQEAEERQRLLDLERQAMEASQQAEAEAAKAPPPAAAPPADKGAPAPDAAKK